jgi:hypothetical protein
MRRSDCRMSFAATRHLSSSRSSSGSRRRDEMLSCIVHLVSDTSPALGVTHEPTCPRQGCNAGTAAPRVSKQPRPSDIVAFTHSSCFATVYMAKLLARLLVVPTGSLYSLSSVAVTSEGSARILLRSSTSCTRGQARGGGVTLRHHMQTCCGVRWPSTGATWLKSRTESGRRGEHTRMKRSTVATGSRRTAC